MTKEKIGRQMSPTVDGIRRDHVARYEWARRHVSTLAAVGIDAGCGCGYGAEVLRMGYLGVDKSQEAINFAKQHYGSITRDFVCADLSLECLCDAVLWNDGAIFDFACAFEVIEHIEDPLPMLRMLRRVVKPGGVLFASVPNEAGFAFDPVRNPHHFRHYRVEDFETTLADAGWIVAELNGQATRTADVGAWSEGVRTHVVVAA